jgi:prolyl-tRNA synthetase family I
MQNKKKSEEGLTIKKEENFSEWYQQLIIKSELADYTDVSGCIVFRPGSFQVWEKIKEECDKRFKKLGIKNCYFPLFIPEKAFKKEQEHVEGFIPEVAWVTQAGNTKLNEKLAIRPTSEAIMYESFSKWIRSWRDLPLKYNQWNNVVRWEFNNPVPFFRTREFLWNEGHSVFASEKESLKEASKIKKVYEEVVEEFMALPGIYGRKTEKEKFAGAVFSEKIHYILPNGRVIEGPCFHHDGQNFAKAYKIKFSDENGKEEYCWQNTYAISTRMLGTMFAIHSDNKGVIIPPKLAENKVVIIPILFDKIKDRIIKEAEKLKKILKEFNPILDDREEYSPGWKYSEWELKGIPLRIEIGPRELEGKQLIIVKRNNGKKSIIQTKDAKKEIKKIL